MELDGRKDIPSVKSAQFYMKNLKAMSYPLYRGKIKDAKEIATYTHAVTSPKLCFFLRKRGGKYFTSNMLCIMLNLVQSEWR